MNDAFFAIDARTMLVVLLASALLMAAVFRFAYAGPFQDGIAKWTASLWAQAFAWLIFATQGAAPHALTRAFAIALLMLTALLQLAAVLEFQRRPGPSRAVWTAPALVFAAFALLSEAPWHAAASDALYSAVNALIAIAIIGRGVRHVRRAGWLLAGCYLVAATTLMAKAGTGGASGGMLHLGTYVLIVAGSFAFLLMHKQRADEESARLATTDPLTGVFNRRTFIELAEQELARSDRASTPLSIMMLDLDHFKRVNDTFGHLAGDEVLVAFTRLVRDCVRRGDLVVRYGGEEFCVLLPATPLSAASALAERIRARCAERPLTSKAFKVTVSIGVTATDGADTKLTHLLARADEALYRAKDEGRNRVVALPLGGEALATQHPLPLGQSD
jgi:diguanylate cyclase (GGDEF)-like protein